MFTKNNHFWTHPILWQILHHKKDKQLQECFPKQEIIKGELHKDKIIFASSNFKELTSYLAKTKIIFLDTETKYNDELLTKIKNQAIKYNYPLSSKKEEVLMLSNLPQTQHVRLISLYLQQKGFLINCELLSLKNIINILSLLKNKIIIMQNAPFDVKVIKDTFGVDLLLRIPLSLSSPWRSLLQSLQQKPQKIEDKIPFYDPYLKKHYHHFQETKHCLQWEASLKQSFVPLNLIYDNIFLHKMFFPQYLSQRKKHNLSALLKYNFNLSHKNIIADLQKSYQFSSLATTFSQIPLQNISFLTYAFLDVYYLDQFWNLYQKLSKDKQQNQDLCTSWEYINFKTLHQNLRLHHDLQGKPFHYQRAQKLWLQIKQPHMKYAASKLSAALAFALSSYPQYFQIQQKKYHQLSQKKQAAFSLKQFALHEDQISNFTNSPQQLKDFLFALLSPKMLKQFQLWLSQEKNNSFKKIAPDIEQKIKYVLQHFFILEKKYSSLSDLQSIDLALSKKPLSKALLLKFILIIRSRLKIQATLLQWLFLASLDKEHKLYPTFHYFSTITGRQSASHPNFQNTPNPDEKGSLKALYNLRDLIYGYSLGYDNVNMEIAYPAALFGDHKFASLIFQGHDVHNINAFYCFGNNNVQTFLSTYFSWNHKIKQYLPNEEFKKIRRITKTLSFMNQYGGGIKAVQKITGLSLTQTKEVMLKIKLTTPKFYKTLETIKSWGETINPFGRHQWFGDPSNQFKASSHLIQGGCADLITFNEIILMLFNYDLSFSIHDEFRLNLKSFLLLRCLKKLNTTSLTKNCCFHCHFNYQQQHFFKSWISSKEKFFSHIWEINSLFHQNNPQKKTSDYYFQAFSRQQEHMLLLLRFSNLLWEIPMNVDKKHDEMVKKPISDTLPLLAQNPAPERELTSLKFTSFHPLEPSTLSIIRTNLLPSIRECNKKPFKVEERQNNYFFSVYCFVHQKCKKAKTRKLFPFEILFSPQIYDSSFPKNYQPLPETQRQEIFSYLQTAPSSEWDWQNDLKTQPLYYQEITNTLKQLKVCPLENKKSYLSLQETIKKLKGLFKANPHKFNILFTPTFNQKNLTKITQEILSQETTTKFQDDQASFVAKQKTLVVKLQSEITTQFFKDLKYKYPQNFLYQLGVKELQYTSLQTTNLPFYAPHICMSFDYQKINILKNHQQFIKDFFNNTAHEKYFSGQCSFDHEHEKTLFLCFKKNHLRELKQNPENFNHPEVSGKRFAINNKNCRPCSYWFKISWWQAAQKISLRYLKNLPFWLQNDSLAGTNLNIKVVSNPKFLASYLAPYLLPEKKLSVNLPPIPKKQWKKQPLYQKFTSLEEAQAWYQHLRNKTITSFLSFFPLNFKFLIKSKNLKTPQIFRFSLLPYTKQGVNLQDIPWAVRKLALWERCYFQNHLSSFFQKRNILSQQTQEQKYKEYIKKRNHFLASLGFFPDFNVSFNNLLMREFTYFFQVFNKTPQQSFLIPLFSSKIWTKKLSSFKKTLKRNDPRFLDLRLIEERLSLFSGHNLSFKKSNAQKISPLSQKTLSLLTQLFQDVFVSIGFIPQNCQCETPCLAKKCKFLPLFHRSSSLASCKNKAKPYYIKTNTFLTFVCHKWETFFQTKIFSFHSWSKASLIPQDFQTLKLFYGNSENYLKPTKREDPPLN